MTAELAARWAGSVVPSWLYRWLMPVGWVAALVVSVAVGRGAVLGHGSRDLRPDRTFSLALIALFASLVLWWWHPAGRGRRPGVPRSRAPVRRCGRSPGRMDGLCARPARSC